MTIRFFGLLISTMLMSAACDAPGGGTHSDGAEVGRGASKGTDGSVYAVGGGPVAATGGAPEVFPPSFGGSVGVTGPVFGSGGVAGIGGATISSSGTAGGAESFGGTATGSGGGPVISSGTAGSTWTGTTGGAMTSSGTTGGAVTRGGATGSTLAAGGANGGATTGNAGAAGSLVGGSSGSTGANNAASRFFLPTGEPDNTSAPTIEVDAASGIHAVYPAYAGGGAYYAYCGPNCTGPTDVKVVRFPTDTTVANIMLALTSDGHPRVLISSFTKIYFGACDSNCISPDGWVVSQIIDHQGDREVTGEALALDPNGHPRFLMHTYRALFGIGQKTPETHYVTCDNQCENAASWTSSRIADTIWEGTHLRFDSAGRARIATVVQLIEGDKAGQKLSAYFECSGSCNDEAAWNGIGFVPPYESLVEAVHIQPTVALALTATGAPRVVVLGKTNDGGKNIIYFECDADCTNDHWQGAVVTNHSQISQGLDLALDAQGRPRMVYTLNYNIGLAYCDQLPCGGPNSNWDLTKVELGSDMPPDQIFLWDNCTVAAWFLHGPSIALTRDGRPRVGYQARDISGGVGRPDPTKPGCVAGTDMTWSRVAEMPSYK